MFRFLFFLSRGGRVLILSLERACVFVYMYAFFVNGGTLLLLLLRQPLCLRFLVRERARARSMQNGDWAPKRQAPGHAKSRPQDLHKNWLVNINWVLCVCMVASSNAFFLGRRDTNRLLAVVVRLPVSPPEESPEKATARPYRNGYQISDVGPPKAGTTARSVAGVLANPPQNKHSNTKPKSTSRKCTVVAHSAVLTKGEEKKLNKYILPLPRYSTCVVQIDRKARTEHA